jgi:AraC-like DNA-binding protein
MDLLSAILRDLRLESVVLSFADLHAPWGFDKSKVTGAPFHIVTEGRALLEMKGRDAIELMAGDLLVLPKGTPHTLVSEPDAERIPFYDLLRANGIDPDWATNRSGRRFDRWRAGGDGSRTRMVNGVFGFPSPRPNHLIAALPDVILVRGRLRQGPLWLDGILGQIVEEAAREEPGFQAIIERFADIIFVNAVRMSIAEDPAGGTSWLRGLRDPQIARVLASVHREPGRRWTLAELAKEAGLSRSVLASRFRGTVGSTVMDYVKERRMELAETLLLSSHKPLSEIAIDAGYDSEISFGRAFRRWAGKPPGQHRRDVRANGHR